MLVHLRVAAAFRRASAAEGDAGGQLRFQELTVADLVGPRHGARRRRTNGGAILIQTNAGDQPLHVLLGKTCIGAGGAGFYARRTGVDTAADDVDMTRLFRMGPEHRADGDCGHAGILLAVVWPNETLCSAKGSVAEREFH